MIVSPTSIKSAGGYSSYLGREVYFQKGDGTPVPGIAFGNLAEELGFKAGEAVNIEDVRALMEGINPDLDGEAWSEKDRLFKERVNNARTDGEKDQPSSPDKSSSDELTSDFVSAGLERDERSVEDGHPGTSFSEKEQDEKKESKEDIAFRNRHDLSKEDMEVIKDALDSIKIEHKAGTDLTFSVPKSLSLAIIRDGRYDLKDAIETALNKTLAHIEEDLIEYRARDEDGDIQRHSGNGAAMVKFMHEFSREGDADIHVHVFLANMTKNKDGDIVALETHPIYQNQKAITLIGAAYLREELSQRKIDTVDHPTIPGFFEIKGFSADELAANSRASARIDAAVTLFIERTGREPTPAERNDLLVKIDRPNKDDVPAEIKTEEVRARNKELGFGPKDYDSMTGTKEIITEKGIVRDADKDHYVFRDGDVNLQVAHSLRRVVSTAIETTTERDSVVHKYQILEQALQLGHGLHTADRIMDTKTWQNTLLTADKEKPSMVTTQAVLNAEKQLLDESIAFRQGGKAFDTEKVSALLKDDSFMDGVMGEGVRPNASQITQIQSILISDHGQVHALGMPGTGKTKGVLNVAMNIIKRIEDETPDLPMDYETPKAEKKLEDYIVGLAPTHQAKTEMEAIGLKTNTVASELLRFENAKKDSQKLAEMKADYEGKILVVDEASMFSVNERLELNEMQRKLGVSKAIFLGDHKQHHSVSRGDSLGIAMAAGLTTTVNREILRQHDKSEAAAVLDLADREVAAAMKGLSGKIKTVEVAEGESVPRAVARDIVHRWSEDRAVVPIMTTTNEMRGLINQEARKDWQERGLLGPDIHKQEVLYNMGLRDRELMNVENHKIGSIMVFHSDPDFGARGQRQRTNLKKDEMYTVIGTNAELNMVTLRHEQSGREGTVLISEIVTEDQKPRFNLFRKEEIKMGEGDMMVFVRKDDRSASDGRTIQNGSVAFFRGVEGEKLKFEDHNGAEFSIQKDSHQLTRMQFGYGVTDYKMQGATVPKAYFASPATSTGAANLTNLVIMASRHREGFIGVTDNIKMLTRRLENIGANANAIEHINEPFEPSVGVIEAQRLAEEKGLKTAFPIKQLSGQHKTKSTVGVIEEIIPGEDLKGLPSAIKIRTEEGKAIHMSDYAFRVAIKEAGIAEGENIKFEKKQIGSRKPKEEVLKQEIKQDEERSSPESDKDKEKDRFYKANYYRVVSLTDLSKQYTPEIWREKEMKVSTKELQIKSAMEYDRANLELSIPTAAGLTRELVNSGPKL